LIFLLAALLGLTPPELRGRELFTKGTSPSGREVTVTIGGGNVTASMPCASCHGSDGTGRTEGGVSAPDIRWDTLLRKYDERGILRAITLGTHLSPVMPRYHLWREDAADLIAYLQRLGTLHDPGLTDDTITIGVLVSIPVMRAAVEQWAAAVNARGGIYTRRLVPRFYDAVPDQDDSFVFIGDGAQIPPEVPLIAIAASDDPGPLVFAVSASPSDEKRALDAARLNPDDKLLAARVLPSEIAPTVLARLQPTALIDQLNILATAAVVEETLRTAGRAVTRESFVTTLESTRDLATPYGPPLTFDRMHHHGTSIVRVLRWKSPRQLE
jgi:mono/diheme cytochrome c family protein